MSNFAFDVSETARAIRREFDRRAALIGATGAQWRVLVRLRRRDGLRQVELAELLDVEPITMCRMIDRLEETGLVERRRDEADRRAWLIYLTPKARPLLEQLQAVGDDFLNDALAGISEMEQQAVRAVLDRVRDNLSKGDATAARKAS